MQWISPRDLQASGVRLFCLPHAGSGSAGFYRWKRLLPPTIAVCPVALPGREARLGELSLRTVTAIVDELQRDALDCLDRPYAIFGHSMGALLAFEWARRISADGLPEPVGLIVSGRNAPQVAFGHRTLHALPDEDFVHQLGERYGGAPQELLADPEMRDVFLPILRADLAVVESYSFAPGEPLSVPLVAFAGADDRSVSDGGLAAWSEVAEKKVITKRIAGDHFYHFGPGQMELLRLISEQLST